MRGRSDQSGFTIIEVTLFLAISGLLFMVGFMGISSRTRNVQLTDSMQSLNAEIKDVFSDVFTGVNTRGNDTLCTGSPRAPGQAYDCVVLGYVLQFRQAGDVNHPPDRVVVHKMIGNNLSATDLADLPSVQRKLFSSRVRSVSTHTYQIEWGSVFIGGRVVDRATTGNPSIPVDNVGFMRVPGSSGVVTVSYRAGDFITDDITDVGREVLMVAGAEMENPFFCFEGTGGRRASFEISDTGNSTLNVGDERCNEL